MLNTSKQVTSLLLFALLSGCLMAPKKELSENDPTSSKWKEKDVAVEVIYSFRKVKTPVGKDRVVSRIEKENFFKSINQDSTTSKFVLTFSECSEKASIAEYLWSGLNVLTLTIVPFWRDQALCLEAKGGALATPLQFRSDYRFWSSIVLLPVGPPGFTRAADRIEDQLVLEFLSTLAKQTPTEASIAK